MITETLMSRWTADLLREGYCMPGFLRMWNDRWSRRPV